ncbi:hypothetical protein GLOTRDRAFT_96668 [Gloeophyllum trabeum ATCC 11539]|uniref:Uncharacterized protein n=1 Tax=Gloeophyllum trabeum (strain ATCC 11539 / FP-39264 / Madison 617) TaxID=670483 RepID=S7PUY5_GLOTA|nr:uncharacterized protein GLOTRDRAFT_96668 [Gloeophyllum trabeum ATCC 11539]EPQ51132.1 hypothetical protein GLOTRDRAFT_96668 [Gloeophyllum trabeum ATCC 11539]
MEFGPGRTMDRFLSFMGARLTSLISRVSERQFKKGPNALVGMMINRIEWKNHQCAIVDCTGHPRCKRLGENAGLRKFPPSFEDVVELLFAPYCRICRDSFAVSLSQNAVFSRGCGKLVAQLRNASPSARLLAAYYVCALASFHPSIRQIFVNLRAPEVLRNLVNESEILSSALPAESSRRALASVSESALLPAIKDFDALEHKLSEYYRQKLTDKEMIVLLPYTVTSLSRLTRGLMEPQLQVLAASRLSSSIVWQELAFTSIIPGLRAAVNSGIVQYLWHLIASTSDPIVFGVVGCMIQSLYEFASLSCANQWNILEQRYVPSFSWAWHTLWIPLFRLRLYYPLLLRRIAVRWPLVALIISVQARSSIRALRQLVTQALAMAPRNARYTTEDPVLHLMLTVTDPLYEIAGLLQEERLVAMEYDGYDIPRHIPYQRLCFGCPRSSCPKANLCASNQTMDELRALLEPYKASVQPFQRRRADILIEALDVVEKASESNLHCTGITACLVHSEDSDAFSVFSDHYKGPWPPERSHDPDRPFATLIVEETYRDLRWISIPDLRLDGIMYRPIPAPMGEGNQYIARTRNMPLDEGKYILVDAHTVQSSGAPELATPTGYFG